MEKYILKKDKNHSKRIYARKKEEMPLYIEKKNRKNNRKE